MFKDHQFGLHRTRQTSGRHALEHWARVLADPGQFLRQQLVASDRHEPGALP